MSTDPTLALAAYIAERDALYERAKTHSGGFRAPDGKGVVFYSRDAHGYLDFSNGMGGADRVARLMGGADNKLVLGDLPDGRAYNTFTNEQARIISAIRTDGHSERKNWGQPPFN